MKTLEVFANASPTGTVVIPDNTSTVGGGLTGLTFASAGLRISVRADNEATTTVYTAVGSTIETITTLGVYATPTATKCRFREYDATNHPGQYDLQFDPSRWAVSGAKRLYITVQVTGGVKSDTEIQLTGPDISAAAGGTKAFLQFGTGTGQISPTAGNLVAASLATQAKLDVENAVWEANINNHVSGSTFGLIPRPLYSANATGSSSSAPFNTITLDSGAMGTDGFYVGAVLVTYGNPGYGQARTITGYVGSTKVATVTPAWTTNVGSGTSFGIYPANTNFPPNQGLLSIDSSGRVILAPSAFDAIVVETGVNARQALSPIFAAAAGLVSGAGTGTIVIKAGNVSATTRITATTDASGNRSAVTLVIPT